MSAFLKLTNRLGMELSVAIEGDTDPLDVARVWSRQGWRAVSIPPGGLRMPFAMAHAFDWALLGAREDVLDNEAGVWFDGHFFKRRDLPANPKKKLTEAIKYSRGAKATDDPIYVEGDDDGNFKYVTLVSFRGGGSPIRDFERRGNTRPTNQPPEQKPPLKGEALADAIARGDAEQQISQQMVRAIEQAQKDVGASDNQLANLVLRISGGVTREHRDVTQAQGQAIFEALANYKKVPA